MTNDDRAKLRTLLTYWIEHNEEHVEEFQEWAEKAKAFGESEICDEISQAARELARANEPLNRALRKMEGGK
jgi:hypothetical protein